MTKYIPRYWLTSEGFLQNYRNFYLTVFEIQRGTDRRTTDGQRMKYHANSSTFFRWAKNEPSLTILTFNNKRLLGLTVPLCNNTWSMIHSPMNTKWPWFDLQVQMSRGKLKDHILFTMCLWKMYMMLHLGDATFWSHVTLIRPWKFIQGQMSWGKLLVHRWLLICVSNKLWPKRA